MGMGTLIIGARKHGGNGADANWGNAWGRYQALGWERAVCVMFPDACYPNNLLACICLFACLPVCLFACASVQWEVAKNLCTTGAALLPCCLPRLGPGLTQGSVLSTLELKFNFGTAPSPQLPRSPSAGGAVSGGGDARILYALPSPWLPRSPSAGGATSGFGRA